MAVVINEFEVVPQTPAPSKQAAQQPPSEDAPALTAEEIAEQMRRQHLRQLRVRAH